MEHVVYSFDPRSGHSTEEEVRAEIRGRYHSPTTRTATWQRDDGDEEARRQVEAIVATTRPLRLTA